MHIAMAMNHSPARNVSTVPKAAQLAASAIARETAKIAITGL